MQVDVQRGRVETQQARLGPINLVEGIRAPDLGLLDLVDVHRRLVFQINSLDVVERVLNRNLPYISGPQWLYENI